MLEFFKNDIVINWIAPIVTGLIVVAVPTIIVKVFRLKRDERTVKTANQRYLNLVMPFIIQKIKISSSYITDIRNVILQETNLKDKYLYSELDLRNKLIADISETKYIDEKNKIELINFTYEVFNSLENRSNILLDTENDSKRTAAKIILDITSSPLILLILSQLIIVLVTIFDKREIKMEENILIMLPFLLGFISVLGIVLMIISKIFDSNVSKKGRKLI